MVVLNDLHFRLLETFVSHVKASGGETESDDILAIDGFVRILLIHIDNDYDQNILKQLDREFISSISYSIHESAASAIKVLRSLKDLDMILNAMRQAVDHGLSMAQKKLLPVTRHHGFLSLPLETVAQIFRQVYDDDADCATQSIPLVNHYFRDIAIGTPDLWTRLSPHSNPRLFMERSKLLGLEVYLYRDQHYRLFLKMVAPEAERWTSLALPSRYDPGDEELKWTRKVVRGKTLTALRVLRIGGDFYLGSFQDSDLLCRSWKMPSLRTIESKNKLPSIHPASLTCFHLSVNSWSSDVPLVEIARFLQTVPLLTELSLGIDQFKTVTFRTGTKATLPNIKILRLRVKVVQDADSSLTDFFASLHTPKLSDLSVDVTATCTSQLTGWINAIFPKGNSSWPSLETLDISMSYHFHDYACIARDHLLERIPAVRHLSISAVNVNPPDPTDWNVRIPHLRTLSLRDCNEFDIDFILDIREIFEAPEFETLKIHNCKKIDTGLVREMMPEGKAFVSTVDWNDDISVL